MVLIWEESLSFLKRSKQIGSILVSLDEQKRHTTYGKGLSLGKNLGAGADVRTITREVGRGIYLRPTQGDLCVEGGLNLSPDFMNQAIVGGVGWAGIWASLSKETLIDNAVHLCARRSFVRV